MSPVEKTREREEPATAAGAAASSVQVGGTDAEDTLARGMDEALVAELGPAGEPAAAEPTHSARPAGQEDGPEGSAGENSPEEELPLEELERAAAALLFASHEPLSSARLASLLGGQRRKHVEAGLAALSERLAASGLPFELRPIAGGWQLFTTSDMAETVATLARAPRDDKVSPAALETLAIVAYRQPVTKAEVEAIRGVQVGPILRSLVDRGLVRVTGRSPDPGHPLLYGTTRRFLDVFGLASLDELPRDGELLRD